MAPTRSILLLNERDPEHPRAGGAEIHVQRLLSRLVARGHTVTWHATGFVGAPASTTIDGIAIERKGPLPLYYAGLPGRVRGLVRRTHADLVVESLNKVPFYAPLYAGLPVLGLCHHLFGRVAFDQVAWPIALGVVAAEAGLSRVYRRSPFLAISDSTAADLRDRGIEGSRIVVSPPGIDPPRLEVDPRATRPPRLTYLGRLERYKRVDMMFRVAEHLVDRFPDLELLVIGRGPDAPRLERFARDLGLEERTRFAGFVSDAERDYLLSQTRVCLFPSEKEGWGLTVIEANALATPVVARDAPGLRDSVRDGETGRLVASDTHDEVARYAEAISALLVEDEATLEVRKACLDWSRRFDWERATDDLETAIERTIEEAGG